MDTFPYYLFLFGLGCLHALEPGHGKSLVAAYLLGQQAKPSQALLLGGTVGLLHAVGALSLLALAMAFFQLAPDAASAWSSSLQFYGQLLAGLVIIGLGVWLLLSEAMPSLAGGHHCDHPDHETKKLSFGQVVFVGALTGLAPCSVSVVALLAALQIGEVVSFWPKVPALLSFSAGLGVVIMGIGLMAIYAKKGFSRWFGEKLAPWHGWLHKLTAIFIIGLGLWVTIQALQVGGGHAEVPVWL